MTLPASLTDLSPMTFAKVACEPRAFLEVILHQPRTRYGTMRVFGGLFQHFTLVNGIPFGKRIWVDRSAFAVVTACKIHVTVLQETDEDPR